MNATVTVITVIAPSIAALLALAAMKPRKTTSDRHRNLRASVSGGLIRP